MKKSSKKGLTISFRFGIIAKLARATGTESRKAGRNGGQERAGANLENDTEKINAKSFRKTAKIPKSEKRGAERRGRKEPEGGEAVRIKRKSLILAQDERWRRA